MAIKCQLTRDLMVCGWNFPYCNFPPRLSYTTRSAIFHRLSSTRSAIFHKERKWESFFFSFLDNAAFMCKHLYHCNFLVLSLSLKKKKKSEYSLMQIFFFFCWIFYCFLVHKRVLHLKIFYVTVYFTCRLKNDKKSVKYAHI